MDPTRDDDELRETVAELQRTVEALQRETPGPRPPSPGSLLRFTEEYTIPTVIAMLEATIRSLELLRAVLRVAGGRGFPDTRSRRDDAGRVISDTGRRALDSLDSVLADLQDAVEGQPTDERARDLLDEARDLRRDIDDMVAGRSSRESEERGADAAVTITVEDEDGEPTASGDDDPDEVDVDAELDTIKRELGKDEDEDEDGENGN